MHVQPVYLEAMPMAHMREIVMYGLEHDSPTVELLTFVAASRKAVAAAVKAGEDPTIVSALTEAAATLAADWTAVCHAC